MCLGTDLGLPQFNSPVVGLIVMFKRRGGGAVLDLSQFNSPFVFYKCVLGAVLDQSKFNSLLCFISLIGGGGAVLDLSQFNSPFMFCKCAWGLFWTCPVMTLLLLTYNL